MFVIQRINDQYYFHNKGKIILFDTPQEAELFLQNFQQYSLQRLVETKGPEGIFDLQKGMFSISIIEKDFEEVPECGVINFKELIY